MKAKSIIPIQLRFNDTDALGHVNNSTYFSFYDLGKTEYFSAVRGRQFIPNSADIVVAHVEVDFIEPVFLSDEIAVQTRVTKMGNKSLDLEQQIVDMRSGGVKCHCKTVMVGYDFKTKSTKRIDDDWREAIARYEERPDFLQKDK